MCGITFVHKADKKPANKSIMKRYRDQKHRGSDGFGFLAIHNGKLKSYKRAKLESQIEDMLNKEEAQTVLFHHRYPTSTPNFKESAHPIKVSSIDLTFDYYVVHNGIITNADDLKEKHEALGFVYNTEITKKFLTSDTTYKESMFNDSEALAIELALTIDKGTMSIEAKGSIAFIVAQVHKSTNKVLGLWYGRNDGSPLKISKNKDFISIGSETEGQTVPANNSIFRLDIEKMTVSEYSFNIPLYQVYSSQSIGFHTYENNYKGYKNPAQTTFGLYDDDDYSLGYEDILDADVIDMENRLMEIESEVEIASNNMKIAQNSDNWGDENIDNVSFWEDELIGLYHEKELLEAELAKKISKAESKLTDKKIAKKLEKEESELLGIAKKKKKTKSKKIK